MYFRNFCLFAAAVTMSLASLSASAPQTYLKRFYVRSEAMWPNFEIDDQFMAKMGAIGAVTRGDLLMIQANEVQHFKRVVGLPGDRISIQNGIVLINNRPVLQRVLATKILSQTDERDRRMQICLERFPGELVSHKIANAGATLSYDFAAIKLGADQYFFLGDNRDNSADSRHPSSVGGLGIVNKDNIVGRFSFVLSRGHARDGLQGH
jgi:signal peptidase I